MSVSPEEQHRRDDEACIFMLERTSHSGDAREYLADCPYCQRPHWVRSNTHGGRPYCSHVCRVMDYYHRNRRVVIARQLAYQRRRAGVVPRRTEAA